MFYKKGGGDIWSILTLNNVFFLGKMEKTRVAEGGFTYSHNIISIYHPKWWFFGEDQKCSWGPKMKNKPNFFFGFPNWWGWGGDPPLGNFSHIIPFFSLTTFLSRNLYILYVHLRPTLIECLHLRCLDYTGQAGRRQWARQEEEKARWEREGQWLARLTGRNLARKGDFPSPYLLIA